MKRQSLIAMLTLAALCGQAFAQQRPPRQTKQKYSLEQAVSDNAQLHTIAFSGLAFVTGSFGASTFLPPGKVCDYFGFQYMRDIDAQGKGHNPIYLGRVAGNVLHNLSVEQRAMLASLAREQAPRFTELAEMRLPVIGAFHQQLAGDVPAGSNGLNDAAVQAAVARVFTLDAELAFERAELFGKIAASLSSEQKAYFGRMKFGDFGTWPEVSSEQFKLPRGTEKMVNVAYMTYASEFFSWYAGSVEADVYFCPERHGTYFGGFYMKDMPAMGKKDYDISTAVTGDSGKAFLDLLTPQQRRRITGLPDAQRASLRRIVEVRREMSKELRKFLAGGRADRDTLLASGAEYGRLDGHLSWLYATAFSEVGQSLSPDQRAASMKLRNLDGYTPAAYYIYSADQKAVPDLSGTNTMFFPPDKEVGK